MRKRLIPPLGFVLFASFGLISGAEAQMSPENPGIPIPPVVSTVDAPQEGGAVVGLVSPADGQGDAPEVAKQRDPFWPVGYVPKKINKNKDPVAGRPSMALEPTPEPVKGPVWEEARKKVDIRGISLLREKNSNTPKYIAMVAGKLVETGGLVTVRYDGYIYRWRVTGITDEGVSLQKFDAKGE